VNRTDFQQLADLRIDEAVALLNLGKFDGAYYLAGYAVECAFKACIAKLTREFDFPPDRETINTYYKHKAEPLVKATGLESLLKVDMSVDSDLQRNWRIVKDWSEQSRYERKTAAQAQQLIAAITDPVHGVLPWIKRHW
jgi:hypothetical protein